MFEKNLINFDFCLELEGLLEKNKIFNQDNKIKFLDKKVNELQNNNKK